MKETGENPVSEPTLFRGQTGRNEESEEGLIEETDKLKQDPHPNLPL